MECAYIDGCVICWPIMCTPSCLSGKVICKWSSVMSFHVEAVNSVSSHAPLQSYYIDRGGKEECVEIGALSSGISD